MRKTYYDVLGLAQNADEKEIRGAYRRLVLLYHPDRNSDPAAADMFIRVAKAYEVLTDPERRKSYDRLIDMETAERQRAKNKPAPIPVAERSRRDPGPIADLVRLTTLLNRGRYVEAEQLAQRIVKHYPSEALPYAVLGDIARYRGELKQAAKLYAYAAQMDARNPMYQRKHEEMLLATTRPTRGGDVQDPEDRSSFPLMVGTGIVIMSGAYLALSKEKAIFNEGPVSTWTLGLCVMLFLCGVAMGACLTLGGLLDRFWAYGGAAVMRFPPSLVLGLVALVNFWAAAALYIGVGASQNAFNPSTSRLVAAVAAVTGILAFASGLNHDIEPLQTLMWGGNVAYIGALCGWMVSDGFRD